MGSRFFKNYDEYRITYPFGTREILGQTEHHAGVDLVAVAENGGALSDWVIAFDAGEVIEAGYSARSGYYCKIRHDEAFSTIYCHFKAGTLRVAKGDRVDKAALLGYMGSTGRSTGAHLHFGASLFGEWVDPEQYFDKDLCEVNELVLNIERKLLKRGAVGDEVKLLQTLLSFHGADIECDSSFGPATQKAVVAFQKQRNLSADGIVGAVTWQELLKISKTS